MTLKREIETNVLVPSSAGTVAFLCVERETFSFLFRREDGGKFPGDEEKVSKLLVEAVATVGCLKWENICCKLLDTCALKDIREISTESSVRLQLVLERWVRKHGEGATVGELMKACKRSEISRSCIEKEFEDLLS